MQETSFFSKNFSKTLIPINTKNLEEPLRPSTPQADKTYIFRDPYSDFCIQVLKNVGCWLLTSGSLFCLDQGMVSDLRVYNLELGLVMSLGAWRRI